jgi:hypothetical protein
MNFGEMTGIFDDDDEPVQKKPAKIKNYEASDEHKP